MYRTGIYVPAFLHNPGYPKFKDIGTTLRTLKTETTISGVY